MTRLKVRQQKLQKKIQQNVHLNLKCACLQHCSNQRSIINMCTRAKQKRRRRHRHILDGHETINTSIQIKFMTGTLPVQRTCEFMANAFDFES